MNLDEAIAVYLYLQHRPEAHRDMTAAWREANKIINTYAVKAIERGPKPWP